jgi:hypothetical protein
MVCKGAPRRHDRVRQPTPGSLHLHTGKVTAFTAKLDNEMFQIHHRTRM